MVTDPAPEDVPLALAALATWREEYLTGDEKSEAQIFLDRLFRAYGHAGIKEAGATLEERIKKDSEGGTAFADLMWKPRCLIEMKKAKVNLKTTYRQAFDYWVRAVPDRPRYVVLCNFDEFWVYDFDSQVDEPVEVVSLADLPSRWESLAFLLSVEGRPIFNNDLVAVTRDAAAQVAEVFTRLRSRGVDRAKAQRFILQAVMAMFAEDIGLLPSHVFTSALDDALKDNDVPATAYDLLFGLFREMNAPGVTAGGRYKGTRYFNGGLFADTEPLELTVGEVTELREAATTDWSAVRPEIFGTLFEQSMDSSERHAHGAHFTSQADIAHVVTPTIVTPWRERIAKAKTRGAGGMSAMNQVIMDMSNYRVLDPACGSGNFLYVAYREMRRLEREAIDALDAMRTKESIAAQATIAYIDPSNFHGIDSNPFAVEIAKVTMMLGKKLAADELDDHHEVLPLDNLDSTIVTADALFTEWPKADAVIGNPPYLGRPKMVEELGAYYCSELARKYPDIGGKSDFVTYWFPLAHDHLDDGGRAGFVATKTIRQNVSREVSLDYIADHGGVIFDAVSSMPWSGDAVVTVSIVNWIKNDDVSPKVLWLNSGELRLEVDHIPTGLHPDVDVRTAVPLSVNRSPHRCFQGQTPGVTAGYVISKQLAKTIDPSGDCTYPFLGGSPMLKHPSIDSWIIDISERDGLAATTNHVGAMQHLAAHVLPERDKLVAREDDRNAKALAKNPDYRIVAAHNKFQSRWWQLWRRREEMLEALAPFDRYIVLTRVASEDRLSVYVFVDPDIRPGDSMQVFAFDDDYSFGILSSSLHRAWFDARCSTLKRDPRYTPTTVWDSFPWPQSPDPASIEEIVLSVARILELREAYRQRGVTLAVLYDTLRQPGANALRTLHNQLDASVHEAYGLSTEDDPLAQLLALNQDIAADPESARGPGPSGLAGTRTTDYRLTVEERF